MLGRRRSDGDTRCLFAFKASAALEFLVRQTIKHQQCCSALDAGAVPEARLNFKKLTGRERGSTGFGVDVDHTRGDEETFWAVLMDVELRTCVSHDPVPEARTAEGGKLLTEPRLLMRRLEV
jgi:hypothetical protein